MSRPIPVIINNRDLLTWPKAIVERIRTYKEVGDIIIIDNGSTYKPLLEWYNTTPCKVIRKGNLGHAAPWISGIIRDLKCDFYVVTDSDLGLNDTPDDTLIYLREKLISIGLNKLGLGLDWEIVSRESPYYNHLNGYEKNRWSSSKVIDNIYTDIMIDTTFALYPSSIKHYFIGGASTGKPYIAKHFPWYIKRDEIDSNEEFLYYLDHASHSCSYKKVVKYK